MNKFLLADEQKKEIWLRASREYSKKTPFGLQNDGERFKVILEHGIKTQARHIFERLDEKCDNPAHFKKGQQKFIKRHRCPVCMAEFEKELIGEK